MARLPWDQIPAWLKAERARALLATRRPAPSGPLWKARIAALSVVVRDLPGTPEGEAARAETRAMFAARDEWLNRGDAIYRDTATVEEAEMLWCAMRAEAVLGLHKGQTHAQQICFVDGRVLPPRRIYWCSDECVTLWTSNHEWSAASSAALQRDEGRCQKCGYDPRPVCNGRHVLPGGRVIWGDEGIASKGVRMDDRPPWPCPQHPHPVHRGFHDRETPDDPGVCGRDGQAWPCDAQMRGTVPGHWQYRKPRQMEVNHRSPRNGKGYGQSCAHHLEPDAAGKGGLETLCHPCHVVETMRQGRERRAGPGRSSHSAPSPGPP